MISVALLVLMQSGESGQYFIRRPDIDESIYRFAESDLSNTTIMSIVRKQTDGKLLAWNLRGQILNAKNIDVPGTVSEVLKNQQIAIRIKQPIVRQSIEKPSHSYEFSFQRTFNQFTYQDIWAIASVHDAPFVDIPFTIQADYVVGSFSPKLGQVADIDGTNFIVKDDQKYGSTPGGDFRRVFQNIEKGPVQHRLTVQFNRKLYVSDHPGAPETGIACQFIINDKAGIDVPRGMREVFVTTDKPIKYWIAITVHRLVKLDAVIKRVPTSPQ